ncbi:MAG: hypothetical protein J4O04_05150 [Chloroflexi bacterium]|nr:hypothetical protein [Chloroflexota bacterium]
MRFAVGKRYTFAVGGLLLLAMAVTMMVFAIGHSSDTTEAATDGAAMSLRVDASQTTDCLGGPVQGKVCVGLGQKFDVIVVADAIPPNGYILAQAWIDYDDQGLAQKKNPVTGRPNVTMIWPDGEVTTFLTAQSFGNGSSAGALTRLLPPQPASFHKGDIYSFSLTCTSTQSSSTINLLPSGDPVSGTAGALFIEFEPGPGGMDVGSVSGGTIPAVSGIQVTCVPPPTATPTATPPPIPRMQKCDQADNDGDTIKDAPGCSSLVNVFLTRQGAKIPPGACLATKGTTANIGQLAEKLNQTIVTSDPKDPSSFQQLAAFEFEVHYDNTKVCVDLNEGPDWVAAGAVCIIEDDQPDSKPQLEGVARIGCVTIGKDHGIDELDVLATVDIYPQPELYSEMKPNQDNGVVVQINNVNCDLSDEQGHAIPIFSCDDADITLRFLEGDVVPDCVVDAMDAQAMGFRWGVRKGSLLYDDWFNLEPSSQQQDNDIDINDFQFVFGRFGSTCKDPHPWQGPVNSTP